MERLLSRLASVACLVGLLAAAGAASPPVAGGRTPNELGRIPILMYHSVGGEREFDGGPLYDRHGLNIAPATFRRQLQRMCDAGWYPVNMRDALSARLAVPRGKTPVVLTFDDARPSQFRLLPDGRTDPDCAVGILEAFHTSHPDWPRRATFYVLPESQYNGVPFDQDGLETHKLRFLVRHGYELGSHTTSHRSLAGMDAPALRWEMAACARYFRRRVPGLTMDTTALPYGIAPRDRRLWSNLLGRGAGRDPLSQPLHPAGAGRGGVRARRPAFRPDPDPARRGRTGGDRAPAVAAGATDPALCQRRRPGDGERAPVGVGPRQPPPPGGRTACHPRTTNAVSGPLSLPTDCSLLLRTGAVSLFRGLFFIEGCGHICILLADDSLLLYALCAAAPGPQSESACEHDDGATHHLDRVSSKPHVRKIAAPSNQHRLDSNSGFDPRRRVFHAGSRWTPFNTDAVVELLSAIAKMRSAAPGSTRSNPFQHTGGGSGPE